MILAGGALLAAIVLRSPGLAAAGIPALAALAFGLLAPPAGPDDVEVTIDLDREVLTEGDRVTVTIGLLASRPVPRCAVELACPPGFRPRDELAWLLTLATGAPVSVSATLDCLAPGLVDVGPVRLSVAGHSALRQRHFEAGAAVRVLARSIEQSLRTLPRSDRVRVAAGDRLARSIGDGIELAEVRAERPGERVRRLNWRATARTGIPHVTVRRPEQSTDIVLFVDTFEHPSLHRVLGATATAAAGYLLHRDRVGLVAFGGVLDWIEPGTGSPQLDRIRTRLAATSPFFSYAWKTIDRIPPRALPQGSLVVAFSPLRDERFTSALGALRGRGHEVVVVEVVPEEAPIALAPRPTRRRASAAAPPLSAVVAETARLLMSAEQDLLRHRLWLRQIPVAPLLPADPLEAAFAMLNDVRRRARPGASMAGRR
jgi:uncharacterized protein (DUF58 family)